MEAKRTGGRFTATSTPVWTFEVDDEMREVIGHYDGHLHNSAKCKACQDSLCPECLYHSAHAPTCSRNMVNIRRAVADVAYADGYSKGHEEGHTQGFAGGRLMGVKEGKRAAREAIAKWIDQLIGEVQ